MRTESKIIHDVNSLLPDTTRDVLVWFEGSARPGVGHYDPEAKAWRIVTSPKGTEGTWPTAWADYPLPDDMPTPSAPAEDTPRFALAREYAELHTKREELMRRLNKIEDAFLEADGPLLIVVDGTLIDFSADPPTVSQVSVAVD